MFFYIAEITVVSIFFNVSLLIPHKQKCYIPIFKLLSTSVENNFFREFLLIIILKMVVLMLHWKQMEH